MMFLLLVALITAVAAEVAHSPNGRHRGARRLVPIETERNGAARHRG
jgi:hypothetical protein